MKIEKTGNKAKTSKTMKTTEAGGSILGDGTILSVREKENIMKAYTEHGATQNSLSKNYDIPIAEMNVIVKSTDNLSKDFKKK